MISCRSASIAIDPFTPSLNLIAINYLKPCMARTGDLQDFNRGTICGQRGLPMAAMLGPGGPSVAATLGPGDRLWGDHRWHDSSLQIIQFIYVISGT